jgi:Protein of unknown function (DUF3500)
MKKNMLLCFLLFFSKNIEAQKFNQLPTIDAAKNLISGLSIEQKAKGLLTFDDPDRLEWSNLPLESVVRKGLKFNELSDTQRQKIHALLRTTLSPQGYLKALFIIQYDESTHERLTAAKSPIAQRYGNQNYWITFFGEPSEKSVWGWQFEGHHLSLNFTHSPVGVTCTPMFTGINPALTTSGDYAGNYVMADENELGKQLFTSLSAQLKQKALIASLPNDIDVLARTGKEPFFQKNTEGVAFTEMNVPQREMVIKIIKSWVENLHPALAQEKMMRIEAIKEKIRFVWMGTNDVEQLHYYRLIAPTFIIEFATRDQGIHHFHTLWRDLEEDFKGK